MGWMADETGLERNSANFVPLTPLSHLRRAAQLFPDHEAVVYRGIRRNYSEYHERCTRLASALAKLGVAPGDVVSTLLPNLPAHAEAHFGVPACGGVLNAINTRLEAGTIAYILDHGGAKVLLADPQFVPVAAEAFEEMENEPPILIEVADDEAGVHAHGHYTEYEELLASGDPDFEWIMPQDEWESLALNYTSGTTGRPKGVVHSHSSLLAGGWTTSVAHELSPDDRGLCVLPIYHINGLCVSVIGSLVSGGSLALCPRFSASRFWDQAASSEATWFSVVPTIISHLLHSDADPSDAVKARLRFGRSASSPLAMASATQQAP